MTERTTERLHYRREGKGVKVTLAVSLELGMLPLWWDRNKGGRPGVYELHVVMQIVLPQSYSHQRKH